MKKTLIALVLVMAVLTAALANGNSEKLTTIDGTAVLGIDESGAATLMVREKDGTMVQVGIADAELARLQLRDNQQLRVKGVFIGSTEETKVQERVLARTMTVDKTKTAITEPVQLTEQDRLQIRSCETEQKETQQKLQTQTKSQTETGPSNGSGAGTDAGSGTGAGAGAGTGAGSGTGGKK